MDNRLWKRILHENTLITENITNSDELVSAIKKAIMKHFPNSYIEVEFGNRLYPSIHIRFAVGTKKDWASGILQNDPAFTVMTVDGMEDDGSINGKISFDRHVAGRYSVKPGDGSYMAFDSIKVPVRKKTGTPEQIVSSIDKYFDDLKKSMKANSDKLADDYVLKYIR